MCRLVSLLSTTRAATPRAPCPYVGADNTGMIFGTPPQTYPRTAYPFSARPSLLTHCLVVYRALPFSLSLIARPSICFAAGRSEALRVARTYPMLDLVELLKTLRHRHASTRSHCFLHTPGPHLWFRRFPRLLSPSSDHMGNIEQETNSDFDPFGRLDIWAVLSLQRCHADDLRQDMEQFHHVLCEIRATSTSFRLMQAEGMISDCSFAQHRQHYLQQQLHCHCARVVIVLHPEVLS